MTHEPFVDARTAAVFVGLTPGDGPARTDPAMRAFYEWVKVARVPKHYRGKRCLVFRLSELEAAIVQAADQAADVPARLTRMETLAHEHVLRVVGGRPR